MKYENVVKAEFIDRPNRFIARVRVNGKIETVHVKNTGRCRELLLPGAEVYLTEPGMPGRKTRYDLIAVRKTGGVLFNIDSQAPNRVVKEWLSGQGFDTVVPEYRFGDSRIDFYMEGNGRKWLMEVKGCTLEIGGIGYFPDAPTERGTRHLRELKKALQAGYQTAAAFVIQMDDVTEVRPNLTTDPEFTAAFREAQAAGVRILMLPCHIEPDSVEIRPEYKAGWQDHL